MIQFLNNVWVALTSENEALVSILSLPLYPVESLLLMNLFLVIFDIKATKKSKLIYVLSTSVLSIFSSYIIPSPFNVFINYTCTFILIKLVFNLDFLKTFVSLIVSTFIFGLLNVLLQNPYITILNISFETFTNVPIYRLPYLTFMYLFAYLVYFILAKIKYIKFNLELLDNLDKHTLTLLCVNLIIGFLTLCIQLVTTAFYIDIVPLIISILNFILLVSFLVLSIFSFTRMIKLAYTKRELASVEEYNKSLQFLYDKVKGYKHDFDNTVSTMDGFIENNDIEGLKKYFAEVKEDCQITNNVSLLNPHLINNPGIYSLLNGKYFKATESGIKFDIEFFLDLNELDVNMYKFSRILGVLIDNAIEEAEKCDEKIVKVSFFRENKNSRAVITVKNTYSNKDVDTEKIFEKGVSGKENHSGIGLWEVRKYVKKSKNLDLFTSKTNKYFKQELYIYDL